MLNLQPLCQTICEYSTSNYLNCEHDNTAYAIAGFTTLISLVGVYLATNQISKSLRPNRVIPAFPSSFHRGMRAGYLADATGRAYFSSTTPLSCAEIDKNPGEFSSIFGSTMQVQAGMFHHFTKEGRLLRNGTDITIDEPMETGHHQKIPGTKIMLHLGVDKEAMENYKKGLEILAPSWLQRIASTRTAPEEIIKQLFNANKILLLHTKHGGGTLRQEEGFTFWSEPTLPSNISQLPLEQRLEILKKAGAEFFTSPKELPKEMLRLATKLQTLARKILAKQVDAASAAADFALDFTKTHPFNDGNGRMARILINDLLMLSGKQAVHFPEREAYIQAVRKGKDAFAAYLRQVVTYNEQHPVFYSQ